MVVSIKSGLLGLLSGAKEKHSPYHPAIMSSNPNNATAIHGREPWGAKLGHVLREGWHTLYTFSPVNYSDRNVWRWVDRAFLCVCYAAIPRKEHVIALTLPFVALQCPCLERWVGFGYD